MKQLITIILLLTVTVGFSQSQMVKAELDTTNIRIGEQFTYKISVDETENVIIPKLTLKGLEVVDSLKIDTINNRLIKKYLLTGFDSGAFYIPKQQIFIKNQAYFTDSLLVNVATVPIDTTKVKKYPIKSIKDEPYTFNDFKQYLWWILAILAVIGLLLYYFVFRKKKQEAEQEVVLVLSPYEQAIKNLEELDKKLLWQNNKVKEYYSELTEIVREYIERELKVPALESTTNSVIKMLSNFNIAGSIITTKETIKNLDALLHKADLVKFAKAKPISTEIEHDRKITEEVIKDLKPKLIAIDDEVE